MRLTERMSRLVPKGGVGKAIATLAGGTVLAQLIAASSMPVVTRLYTPAEMGVITLFISFFGFWSQLLSLRYDSALFNAKDDSESYQVFRLALYLAVGMSVISAPILFGLIRTRTLGFNLLPLWSPILGVFIFLGYGIFTIYRTWGLRSGLVKPVYRATVIRSACNAGTRVVLGLGGVGVPALFAAEVAGAWGAAAALRRAVHERYFPYRGEFTLQSAFSISMRFIKFPKYDLPSTMLDQLAVVAPVPIIASLFGVQAAGLFGLAKIVVALPNAQLGRAVSDVFQMELAIRVRARDYLAARELFNTLLRKMSLLGLFPLVGMMALGPLLVPWIFGHQWAETGVIMACIAPWLYAALIVGALSGVLNVLESQEYKLAYDFSALFFMITVYLVAKHEKFGLIQTVIMIAASNVVAYAIFMLVIVKVATNMQKVRQK